MDDRDGLLDMQSQDTDELVSRIGEARAAMRRVGDRASTMPDDVRDCVAAMMPFVLEKLHRLQAAVLECHRRQVNQLAMSSACADLPPMVDALDIPVTE